MTLKETNAIIASLLVITIQMVFVNENSAAIKSGGKNTVIVA
jgi:hypothetical protein